jgi:hypothetical protein
MLVNIHWVEFLVKLGEGPRARTWYNFFLRDRSFNLQGWGGGGYAFLFRSVIYFSDNKRVRILFVFFQTLTLGYMTKTLNQILFFLHQNQNICWEESDTLFIQLTWSVSVTSHEEVSRPLTLRQEISNIHISNWVFLKKNILIPNVAEKKIFWFWSIQCLQLYIVLNFFS